MTIDFNKVSQTFADRRPSGEVAELQETYSALRQRVVPYIDVPQGGAWGDRNRIRFYAIAYRQVLLHRAISLFEGALQAAIDENAYVMILAVRASFETTAALGYLHNRLGSLADGNLQATKVDQDIMTQILGTRDEYISQAMPPKQILSMLEYADVSVSKKILGGQAREHTMLRESYDFLCEFAHPNFHSNKLAFDLDKSRKQFVFRYEERMQDNAFSTIGYLLLSSPLHVDLHDGIDEVLPDKP